MNTNVIIKTGFFVMATLAAFSLCSTCLADAPLEQQDYLRVSELLTEMDVWILPQPKNVSKTDGPFDLRACKGIRFVGLPSAKTKAFCQQLADDLLGGSNVHLKAQPDGDDKGYIRLELVDRADGIVHLSGVDVAVLIALPEQGYVLHVEAEGVGIAACDEAGLNYGMGTLVQMATDRAFVPGLHIADWPSMVCRGIHQDISRGQVPTMATFKRLADVIAMAKINVMELYIEHAFKFAKYPEISPSEGITPEEGRALFEYAARRYIEVHPMFQVLGHSHHVLSRPEYQHLRIPPDKEKPGTMTYDVRKPEAVALVNEFVDELCETFPGTYFNVDITEIDIDGFKQQGMTEEEVTDMVFDYVVKLNEMVKRHNMRLMIAQGPLDSTGHLAGLGPKLDQLPRDIMIGCYYTAGGCYQPAWQKDFPRLQQLGFDFFAQAWIYSHSRVMPWISWAGDFSDLEVSRGLQYDAFGSVTCDWGDMGNYHLTGITWYPFVYHGASAWMGGKVDRSYFDQAFTRLFYGLEDDSVAQGLKLAGDISGLTYRILDKTGKIVYGRIPNFNYPRLIWDLRHFFENPFTHEFFTGMMEPAVTGREMLSRSEQAETLLESAHARATRNRDNIEQLLFAARNYKALAEKLLMIGHERDRAWPKEELVKDLEHLIQTYSDLRETFKRLWLDEDRENDAFRNHLKRFDNTINPCRDKLNRIRKEIENNTK